MGTPREVNIATNKQQLLEAAWLDYQKGDNEGKVPQIYLDSNGNPTIGVGHCILNISEINDPARVAVWRNDYICLQLTAPNGRHYSNSEEDKEKKGQEFDALVAALKNGSIQHSGATPDYITSPRMSTMSEQDMRNTFERDFNHHYNAVKRIFGEKFHTFPTSLQIALHHVSFRGLSQTIRAYKKRNPYATPEEWAKFAQKYQAGNGQKRTGQQALADCQELKRQQQQQLAAQQGEPVQNPVGDARTQRIASRQRQREQTLINGDANGNANGNDPTNGIANRHRDSIRTVSLERLLEMQRRRQIQQQRQ